MWNMLQNVKENDDIVSFYERLSLLIYIIIHNTAAARLRVS
jgi:hypothetical protein